MNGNPREVNIEVREAEPRELARVAAIAGGSLDLDKEDAAEVPGYVWAEESGTHRVRYIASLNGADAGVLIGSAQGDQAFLDLVAVLPFARRCGVASALLARWESTAASLGADDLRAGENLRAYAWPGIDIRYTAAICLLRHAGYERTGIVYNMDLPLDDNLAPDSRQLKRLADAGVEVRRAELSDEAALAAHAAALWSEVWTREVLLALEKDPPSIFIATRGEAIIGFAAHGVYRPSLYGPIATHPEEHGHGIGNVLSRLCLADMRARGVHTGQIGWVAEEAIPFYSRTVGARLGRCFWMMRKRRQEQAVWDD